MLQLAKYYITACEEFYSDISSNRAIKIHLAEIQSMCPKYVQAVLQFQGAWRFKNQVKAIDTLNSLVTSILKGDSLPDNIKLLQESDYDEDEMKSTLGNAYATVDTFDWKVLEYRDITDHSDSSMYLKIHLKSIEKIQVILRIVIYLRYNSVIHQMRTNLFNTTQLELIYRYHSEYFLSEISKTSGDLLKI